jgi:hypothetical protein
VDPSLETIISDPVVTLDSGDLFGEIPLVGEVTPVETLGMMNDQVQFSENSLGLLDLDVNNEFPVDPIWNSILEPNSNDGSDLFYPLVIGDSEIGLPSI